MYYLHYCIKHVTVPSIVYNLEKYWLLFGTKLLFKAIKLSLESNKANNSSLNFSCGVNLRVTRISITYLTVRRKSRKKYLLTSISLCNLLFSNINLSSWFCKSSTNLRKLVFSFSSFCIGMEVFWGQPNIRNKVKINTACNISVIFNLSNTAKQFSILIHTLLHTAQLIQGIQNGHIPPLNVRPNC